MLLSSLLLAASLNSLVEAPTQVLPAAAIADAVEEGIRARLAAEGSKATAEVFGTIREQQLPAGEVSIRLGEVAGRWPRERIAVPVELRIEGRHVRSMTVWVELQDERQVLTYAQDYPAATPGTEIQAAYALVNLMCCPGPFASSTEELSSQQTTQVVRMGRPVLLSDFEPVPDVRAQSQVAVVVRRGPIRLTTTGIALDDGVVGDWVVVRPSHSRVAVRSRVVGGQRVEINE